MPIVKSTISRNDSVYECFPCLCLTRTGKLMTIYRESDDHGARTFSNLVLRYSLDWGETWSDRQVLAASSLDDQGDGEMLFKWNCPRIIQLRDGRLCAPMRRPPE